MGATPFFQQSPQLVEEAQAVITERPLRLAKTVVLAVVVLLRQMLPMQPEGQHLLLVKETMAGLVAVQTLEEVEAVLLL